jgi:cyclic pyranopterin monophosphate synthase
MARRGLTHVDARGAARMVDVTEKPETRRRAVAEGFVAMSSAAARAVRSNAVKKGDVLATARIAGIAAAKRTADLVPLCHPLRLDAVVVDLRATARGVRVRAEVGARDRTGVEMEALTAVAVACLTVYDMVKAIDRGARIESVEVVEKEGGRSGPWRRTR